jgi:hypothetical protein
LLRRAIAAALVWEREGKGVGGIAYHHAELRRHRDSSGWRWGGRLTAVDELGSGSAALQSCGAGARAKGKKEEQAGLKCGFYRAERERERRQGKGRGAQMRSGREG